MPPDDTDMDRLAAEFLRAPWWQWHPAMRARTRKSSGWASYVWSPERFREGDIPDLSHATTVKAIVQAALLYGAYLIQPEKE